ncbi:MAG TPA: hypothetical protein VKZ58_01510 [Longimicrobiales bacterium]|nr:hypothetical protein [Longimicrobiales bacterium]
MILRCTYEELAALSSGSERLLMAADHGAPVAAPPEVVAQVESFVGRLSGDISIETLAEAERLLAAVHAVQDHAKDYMDRVTLEQYVGSEDAVQAFFEYSHIMVVAHRLERMANAMAAMIELMTGAPPTPEAARTITFPD